MDVLASLIETIHNFLTKKTMVGRPSGEGGGRHPFCVISGLAEPNTQITFYYPVVPMECPM